MSAIMRPFFRYPGSKAILARKYPRPLHSTIIEPFAGSASYATRYHACQVILVEKNPEIAALWAWLIGADPEEIRSLPTALRAGSDIRELQISDGARLLIRHWQRVGTSTCWTVSKWCGTNTGLWCAATRDAVASNVVKIRHWHVICGDFTEAPDVRATWFIDPPYRGLPLFGSKDIDYAALAAWVGSRCGQVIACEQGGADWLPFEPFREVTTGRHRKAEEAIYYRPYGGMS
jgi:hypothetical protein